MPWFKVGNKVFLVARHQEFRYRQLEAKLIGVEVVALVALGLRLP